MSVTGALLTHAGAAATRSVGRRLLTQRVIHPFLGTPVVLHSSGSRRRRRAAPQPSHGEDAAVGGGQQQAADQPEQREPHARSGGPLRRLCCLCLTGVRALPAAGVRAALLGGARRLARIPCSATGVSGALVAGLALSLTGSGLRRWHGGRRAGRRGALTMGSPAAATEVTVLSFNIRGVMDRWPERAPVLRQTLKAADADVVCFQEVLTGEFRQEQLLLGSSYQVCECRAALQHLSSSSWFGAVLSLVLHSLLGVSWVRSVLVSLPESVESWREKNNMASGWSRLLRDAAIVPFYGNSIATRIPLASGHAVAAAAAADNGGSSSSSDPSCGTLCWPRVWANKSSSSIDSSRAAASDILVLGDFRAAQRVCLQLKLSPPHAQQRSRQQLLATAAGAAPISSSGSSSNSQHEGGGVQQQQQQQQGAGDVVHVWLVNTHLDHASPEIRAAQMQAICRWVEPLKASSGGIIITGDLNAPPDEALHSVAARSGFASMHKVAHGAEPRFTWPSGIVAPLMDVGDPHCADYIYAWQAQGYQLQVLAAQLCGDQPSEADATLYPSDHLGLKVTLRISRCGE